MKAETKGLRAALAKLSERVEASSLRSLENVVSAAEKVARSTTAWKDGTKPGARTRATIRGVMRSAFDGFVEARGAARFLEWGTRPHTIAARRGKTLAFMSGGSMRFARVVHHPGTKATHFMRDAAEALRSTFLRNVLASTNNEIRRFNR